MDLLLAWEVAVRSHLLQEFWPVGAFVLAGRHVLNNTAVQDASSKSIINTATCIVPFLFWLLGLPLLCGYFFKYKVLSIFSCRSCIRVHPAPSPSMPARAACWMRRPKANFISSKSTWPAEVWGGWHLINPYQTFLKRMCWQQPTAQNRHNAPDNKDGMLWETEIARVKTLKDLGSTLQGEQPSQLFKQNEQNEQSIGKTKKSRWPHQIPAVGPSLPAAPLDQDTSRHQTLLSLPITAIP